MTSKMHQDFLFGAVIGGAIGAVAALFLTPQSGTVFRRQIQTRFGYASSGRQPTKRTSSVTRNSSSPKRKVKRAVAKATHAVKSAAHSTAKSAQHAAKSTAHAVKADS